MYSQYMSCFSESREQGIGMEGIGDKINKDMSTSLVSETLFILLNICRISSSHNTKHDKCLLQIFIMLLVVNNQ